MWWTLINIHIYRTQSFKRKSTAISSERFFFVCFLFASFKPIPVHIPERQPLFHFPHRRLVLPIMELHINRVIWYVHFWVKFLWLIKMFQIRPCCVYQQLIPFYCWIVFNCLNTSWFTYIFINTGLGCFQFLSSINKPVMNICFRSPCGHIFSFIFGCYLGAELQDYSLYT